MRWGVREVAPGRNFRNGGKAKYEQQFIRRAIVVRSAIVDGLHYKIDVAEMRRRQRQVFSSMQLEGKLFYFIK